MQSYCVYFTALGALNRGYRVVVVTDAVATRQNMSDVLERYAHKGIGVITSEQLITEFRNHSTKEELP